MDLNDKLQFWKNEIERAEQHGFYFDPDSVGEVVKTVEELKSENERYKKSLEAIAYKGFNVEPKRIVVKMQCIARDALGTQVSSVD